MHKIQWSYALAIARTGNCNYYCLVMLSCFTPRDEVYNFSFLIFITTQYVKIRSVFTLFV